MVRGSALAGSRASSATVAKGQRRQLIIKTREGGRSRGCHLELVEIFEEHGVGGSCKGHIEHSPHLLKCPHISEHVPKCPFWEKILEKEKRRLDEMLTLLGGKQHMNRTARQFLAQIRSDAQNTITVRLDCARLDCAREVFRQDAAGCTAAASCRRDAGDFAAAASNAAYSCIAVLHYFPLCVCTH